MVIPLKVDILHSSSVYFPNYQVLGLTIPCSIRRVHLLWQGISLVQVLFQSEHIQSYVKKKQTKTKQNKTNPTHFSILIHINYLPQISVYL